VRSLCICLAFEGEEKLGSRHLVSYNSRLQHHHAQFFAIDGKCHWQFAHPLIRRRLTL
jgi:hypothetical protein